VASVRRIRHSWRLSGRTSKLVLAVGFVALLALAIGLVQLTRGGTQAATSPLPTPRGPIPAERTPAVAMADSPAAPSPPRQHPSDRAAPREHVAMPVRQPELAPAQAGFTRDLKRDADGHLMPIVAVQELREQLPRTEAPMKACVDRSGQGATGKATLSFTVTARNNKLVIETTGVQDEETLAGHPELLECMHQTAHMLMLDGYVARELGTPIYVRRHIRIENGVLAENSIWNFSYNP
jgi:hypothetical protein